MKAWQPEGEKVKWKLNFQMMAQLERTPSSEIIAEIQRRLGITDTDEIPASMMDQELFDHCQMQGWPDD
ncbi:unnamed protein product [Effrenium voratum]|nr:unnamed protein product [Effrenium voratum]